MNKPVYSRAAARPGDAMTGDVFARGQATILGHGTDSHGAVTTNAALNTIALTIVDFAMIVVLRLLTGVFYRQFVLSQAYDLNHLIATGFAIGVLFWATARLVQSGGPLGVSTENDRMRDAAFAWINAFAVLLLFLFIFKVGSNVSRGSVLTMFIAGLPVMVLARGKIPPIVLRTFASSGHAAQSAIVIGAASAGAAARLMGELREAGCSEWLSLSLDTQLSGHAFEEARIGLVANAMARARDQAPGPIYLCAEGFTRAQVSSLEQDLSLIPRSLFIIPDEATAKLFLHRPSHLGHTVAIEVQREPLNAVQRAAKRAMDMAGALLLLLLLSPVLALIALAIRMDSRGPALFRQRRNGFKGTTFRMLKFRTMHVMEDGPDIQQAEKDDARVTRVGRILRRSSLDELPQLWNVLLGDMALVGPRPHALSHDELWAREIENYQLRQHVKPGMTGWAQVNGLRGQTQTHAQMRARIEHDLWYARNASLMLDATILFRTFFELFRQRNAY